MKQIVFIFLVFCCVACNQTDKKFLVTDENVGTLHRDTPVAKLDSIYAQDSIVDSALEGELHYTDNERIRIFEKGGNQLLELTPAVNNKNTKIVESVQVLDSRFKTDEGISLNSKFKDIKSAYPDLDLQQTIKSLILTPKGKSFYFIIDKSEINKPSIGISDKVNLGDIPSEASIKYIIVNWN